MSVDQTDIYVTLKPLSEWTSARTRSELIEKIETALNDRVPGVAFSFTQSIEMRMSELIAGSRADVAIKLFGDDLYTLRKTADQIGRAIGNVRGAEDLKVEQISGLPQLQVKPDRAATGRYGINVEDVNDLAESVVARKEAGQVYEGEQRFNLVVRLNEQLGRDVEGRSET
jgi:cobalt-zinc-cadmium resistance protein CzcA